MAPEANVERLILAQRGQRAEPNVGRASRSRACLRGASVSRGLGHQLHMALRGSMTRLAVDCQRRDVRLPSLRGTIEADVDLAPVTSLAVGETRLVTEYALWRPVAAVGEAQVSGDGDPPLVQSQSGVAEPRGGLPAPVEGEHTPGPVGKSREE